MASFISKSSIDEVSGKTDIVGLIGEYVNLEQRGNDFWGCCPFHHEKTPSFSVSPDKKFYYCFGCHAAGNAFNFIMQMENVSYAESIEILAKKAGVQLVYENSGSSMQKSDDTSKLKQEYIDLYNRVSTSFSYMLTETPQGKFALDYIIKRGITRETIEKFKLGYSPSDRKWLRGFLEKKNYSKEFLDKSGLFSSRYPEYAFFSDRLMFPIFDRNGQVVAMGGRFLRGDSEKSPKYLNSGDLIQYKKGSTLYAFNFAKQAIRESKKVIFCEGYMDVIAYHQCGINYAVAPLGTALTDEQILLVKNLVDEVYLSFDSDGAGQKATKRAIFMCRKQDIPVKVIRIKGGKDPAEVMVTYGADYLTNEVGCAIIDFDYLLSKLQEMYPKDTPEGKAKASLEFFEYLDTLKLETQKQACLDLLCQAFGIEKEAALKDYVNREQVAARARVSGIKQSDVAKTLPKIVKNAELQAVMTAVTDDPGFFVRMSSEISVDDLADPFARQLFIVMEECHRNNSFSVANILNRIESEEFRALIIKSVKEHSDKASESVEGSINFLKLNVLTNRKRMIQEEIVRLEKSIVEEDVLKKVELCKKKMEIDAQIQKMKG